MLEVFNSIYLITNQLVLINCSTFFPSIFRLRLNWWDFFTRNCDDSALKSWSVFFTSSDCNQINNLLAKYESSVGVIFQLLYNGEIRIMKLWKKTHFDQNIWFRIFFFKLGNVHYFCWMEIRFQDRFDTFCMNGIFSLLIRW